MAALTTSELISRGVRAISDHDFCLAVDLGQSTDPTAICILEHVRTAHVTYKGKETPAGEKFDVRYLQRLPLGLSYVQQVEEIAKLLRRPPLDAGFEFAIDETGVGRPVGDLFEAAGLRPTRITITGGDNASCRGERRWHVPKGLLISGLDARLHSGELRFASELTEAEAMREELRDFRRHISAAGRFSFEARTGRSDDLVLSVALALWVFTRKCKGDHARVGHYSFNGKPIRWRS